ncbi:hypothetical protein SLEP1_g60300 [Rubroshorea leprosula]|uniref:Uncharacterized protein n=1 Tax=Rubroshorea leprosula TaxID=152421 RepID=A0AAV5MUX3_9ROSI|nr:hypothetical protein SLEP1_g60300 [Rubroshorea leprosula]
MGYGTNVGLLVRGKRIRFYLINVLRLNLVHEKTVAGRVFSHQKSDYSILD